MIAGNKYYLRQMIKSNFNNDVYGNKGDQVTLIDDHTPVALVENEKQNRFPVNIKYLSEEKVECDSVQENDAKNNSKPVKKNKKASLIKQPNLL